MDWSRIKTILIIALALANLALGYEVYRQKMALAGPAASKQFSQELLDLLASEDIKISPSIQIQAEKLNSLRVQYENLSQEQLNRDFFHNEALLRQKTFSLADLSLKGESLQVYDGRKLSYRNDLPLAKKKISKEEAKTKAMDFLKEKKFKTDDLVLVSSLPWQEGYQLTFKKVYEGRLVESSYSIFQVDGSGVHSLSRLWLDIIEPSDKEVIMPSPQKALLSLLDKQEARGRTVVRLEACYYFNPSKQGYIEDISRAQQGRAIPAWRIQLDNGQEVIVDVLS